LRFHRILLGNDIAVTTGGGGKRTTTYNFSHVIFVTVCFHVPNYLVAKQLRYLGGLENEIRDIACGGETVLRTENEGDQHLERTKVAIS